MVKEAQPQFPKELKKLDKVLIQQELQRRVEIAARFDWPNVARPEQLIPPGDWLVWLIMAGRGYGKTRTGAETIRQWVMNEGYRHIALIANTMTEARAIMIEGECGLLSIHPENERPHYEPSKRRLTWKNGTVATIFTAENYEQLRGAQFECVWIDELAKFRNAMEMWDQMSFGLRIGKRPRTVVTTTPRPNEIIHMLLAGEGDWVTVTRGTTFDNAANLSPFFLQQIKRQYEGTTFGEQEIYGRVLDEVEGARWKYKDIDSYKVPTHPTLKRIVVSVDPATTSSQTSDETGIIVAGVGEDDNAYVLQDLSGKYSPNQWAQRAIDAYRKYNADRIVAEVNQGGDLVKSIIRRLDPAVSFKGVRATRNKIVRIEPVQALYEQRHVFHMRYGLEKLEEQMCTYVHGQSKGSPDRVDALVWAITELMSTGPPHVSAYWV